MSLDNDFLLPVQALAEGFARHAEAWARQAGRGGNQPAAGEAGRGGRQPRHGGRARLHLSRRNRRGGDDVDLLRRSLLDSGIVGTPAASGAKPLILDGDGRLYLHRYFDYERRLAARLLQCGAAVETEAADAGVAGSTGRAVRRQRGHARRPDGLAESRRRPGPVEPA